MAGTIVRASPSLVTTDAHIVDGDCKLVSSAGDRKCHKDAQKKMAGCRTVSVDQKQKPVRRSALLISALRAALTEIDISRERGSVTQWLGLGDHSMPLEALIQRRRLGRQLAASVTNAHV